MMKDDMSRLNQILKQAKQARQRCMLWSQLSWSKCMWLENAVMVGYVIRMCSIDDGGVLNIWRSMKTYLSKISNF